MVCQQLPVAFLDSKTRSGRGFLLQDEVYRQRCPNEQRLSKGECPHSAAFDDVVIQTRAVSILVYYRKLVLRLFLDAKAHSGSSPADHVSTSSIQGRQRKSNIVGHRHHVAQRYAAAGARA